MSRELLFSITKKDFKITWFSGKGAGGQHRNKHQNCCRIRHLDSGTTTTGQNEKSQRQNLKNAFLRLVNHPNFKKWLRVKTAEITMDKAGIEKEIQKKVNEMMQPENLKIEYLDGEQTN